MQSPVYPIAAQFTTGYHLYALLRNSLVQIYNGTGFETYNSNDYWEYSTAIPMTEQDQSGFYYAEFPANISAPDLYMATIFCLADNSEYGMPSETNDRFVSSGNLTFDGSSIIAGGIEQQLVGLSLAKLLCGISSTDTQLDDTLNVLIYGASAAVEGWCHRKFALRMYSENYDGPGSTTLLLRNHPVVSIQQVTLFQYTNFPIVIPGSDIVFNANTGLISVNPSSTYYQYFPYDGWASQQSIEVNYCAGYGVIPQNIMTATAKVTRNAYQQIGHDMAMISESQPLYKYVRREDAAYEIPADIQALLFEYRENNI